MSGRGTGSKDFLGKPAPLGYVAGIGRGAVGFSTRPDLGPTTGAESLIANQGGFRQYSDRSSLPASAVAALQAKASKEIADQLMQRTGEEDEEFEDNEEGLLAGRNLTAEDIEADRIFAKIDEKLANKRKNKKPVVEKIDGNQPTLMFKDLKRDLERVSLREWQEIPEVGSFVSKKVKKSNEKERFTPLPDSILLTDLRAMGEAREKYLESRLDSLTDDSKSVDPLDYLTQLTSQSAQRMSAQEIKKARMLLKGILKSNPNNPQAWIAASRVEESDLNLKQARILLQEACKNCAECADVWIEALRFASKKQDKLEILGRALKAVPSSPELWLQAAELESGNIDNQKRILKKALSTNPSSAKLWRFLVELEDDRAVAKTLLSKAVEFCSGEVEFWIAYAKLAQQEDGHQHARQILNDARKSCPQSREIWVWAARLEESSNESLNNPSKEIIQMNASKEIIQKAFALFPDPSLWLQDARCCFEAGNLQTGRAIADHIISAGLGERDLGNQHLNLYVCDALLRSDPTNFGLVLRSLDIAFALQDNVQSRLQTALNHFPLHSDQIIENYISSVSENPIEELNKFIASFPSERLYLKLAELNFKISQESSFSALQEGVQKFPQSLELFKCFVFVEKNLGLEYLADLEKGLQMWPSDPSLWLLHPAPFLNEAICGRDPYLWILWFKTACQYSVKSRSILEKARLAIPTSEIIWLYSIRYEIHQNNIPIAKSLIAKALNLFPKSSFQKCLFHYEHFRISTTSTKTKVAIDALNLEGPNPWIYLAIALINYQEGRIENSIEYLEKSLNFESQIVDCWYHYLKISSNENCQVYEKKPNLGGFEWIDYLISHGITTDSRILCWNYSNIFSKFLNIVM